MKVLLTGSHGQVGWEVCRQARQCDIDVIATNSGNLDITDMGAIRAILTAEPADMIINAAAYTAVDKAESEPELAWRVNALGAQNLAQAAAEQGMPILHISTDYVFSGDATIPYADDAQAAPLTAYGRTKLAGEQLLAAANPHYLTLRTSWVFGIEGNNFVKTMLRLAAERDELTVVADQFGCPTFAGHIARALLALMTQYRQAGNLPWGTFNFCDAGITTWHTFAVKILECARAAGLLSSMPIVRPIRTDDYPTAATRPRYSALDCSRFTQTFPHIGIGGWEAGLREMITALSAKEHP